MYNVHLCKSGIAMAELLKYATSTSTVIVKDKKIIIILQSQMFRNNLSYIFLAYQLYYIGFVCEIIGQII